jgi:succinyl-diaminopimelate desuccinylase
MNTTYRQSCTIKEDPALSTAVNQDLLSKLDAWINAHQDELIHDVQTVVNIKSVKEALNDGYPFGPGPAKVIDQGLALGEQYGFQTENDDYYNVSFIKPGKTDRELAILGHVDVVPEGDGWRFEPYQSTVQDGYIIGRGSGDNKGPAIAALYTLRAIDELSIDLDHSIRVIWGANEESGMEDVKHYLKTHSNLPDYTLVCDSEFPVCIGEKGNLSGDLVFDIGSDTNLLDFTGGVAGNAIPDSAVLTIKADLIAVKIALAGKDVEVGGADQAVTIAAKGIAGHAARPEGTVSAIQKLAQIIAEAGLLTGKAHEAAQAIAEIFADYYGEGIGIASEDELSGKTTHIGGTIQYADGQLRQSFNSRVAIHTDPANLVPGLQAVAAAKGFAVEDLRQGPSRYSDPESQEVKILVDTAKEFLGEDLQPPYTMGGGTHAKHFPNSIPFGAKVPTPGTKSPFGGAHAADEGVKIADLLTAVKIFAVALIRLDGHFAAEQ